MIESLRDVDHQQFVDESAAKQWAASVGIELEPGPRGSIWITVPAGVTDDVGRRSYVPAGSDIGFVLQTVYDDAYTLANPLPMAGEVPPAYGALLDYARHLDEERKKLAHEIIDSPVLEPRESPLASIVVSVISLTLSVLAIVLTVLGIVSR